MNSFWDKDVPFIPLLGPDHLLYIGIMVACLLGLILGRRWVRASAETVRICLLVVSVLQFLTLYAWYATEFSFDPSEALPLHISRVSTILGIWFLATKNLRVMDVLFYFGLFAYVTFLLPQRIYPADHAIGWSFVVSHVVTILVPLFAAIAYGWRPSVGGLMRAFGWFLLYFAVVLVVNPLVDGNYFYLKHRPVLAGLPSPLYEIVAVSVTFAAFWVGYGASRLLARGTPHAEARPAGAD